MLVTEREIRKRAAQLLAEESTQPLGHYWLSYVDPQPDRFLGVVIVEARGFTSACCEANVLGISPGGQVAGVELREEVGVLIPPEYKRRLLSRAEAEEVVRICKAKAEPGMEPAETGEQSGR